CARRRRSLSRHVACCSVAEVRRPRAVEEGAQMPQEFVPGPLFQPHRDEVRTEAIARPDESRSRALGAGDGAPPAARSELSSRGIGAGDAQAIPDWAKDILPLERPIAVLDLEATGTAPHRDRIVEISVLKIFPDGKKLLRHRRVNPGIPIP